MHFDVRLQVTEKSELFAAQMTMMRFITYKLQQRQLQTLNSEQYIQLHYHKNSQTRGNLFYVILSYHNTDS